MGDAVAKRLSSCATCSEFEQIFVIPTDNFAKNLKKYTLYVGSLNDYFNHIIWQTSVYRESNTRYEALHSIAQATALNESSLDIHFERLSRLHPKTTCIFTRSSVQLVEGHPALLFPIRDHHSRTFSPSRLSVHRAMCDLLINIVHGIERVK